MSKEIIADSCIWFSDWASKVQDVTALVVDTRIVILGLEVNNWLWLTSSWWRAIEDQAGNDDWTCVGVGV